MAAFGESPGGVRLRGYRPGDEERVVALWNVSLPTDPIAADVFAAKILLDVNFDRLFSKVSGLPPAGTPGFVI
jgi:hypothetical protein